MSYSIALPEDLKKEFNVHPDGKTSCTFRGLARMLLVNDTTLGRHFSAGLESSNLAKTLMEQGFDSKNMLAWATDGLPIEAVIVIAQYYLYDAKQVSNKTKENAQKFLNIIIDACKNNKETSSKLLKYLRIDKSIKSIKKRPSLAKISPEYKIQQKFVKKYGGIIEVTIPVGRIDILTDCHIIEIKNANSWKSAVGQLLMYGHYYPKHQKVMYLFDLKKYTDLDLIKYHCQDFFIDVITENELDDYMLTKSAYVNAA